MRKRACCYYRSHRSALGSAHHKLPQSPAFLFFIEGADVEQISPFGNDSFRRHCLFVLNHACFNGHEFMAFLFVIARKNLPKVFLICLFGICKLKNGLVSVMFGLVRADARKNFNPAKASYTLHCAAHGFTLHAELLRIAHVKNITAPAFGIMRAGRNYPFCRRPKDFLKFRFRKRGCGFFYFRFNGFSANCARHEYSHAVMPCNPLPLRTVRRDFKRHRRTCRQLRTVILGGYAGIHSFSV